MRDVDDALDRTVIAEEVSTEEGGDRFEKASGYINETFEDDTRREQSKRLKAVAWGVGSIALGATLGHIFVNLGNGKSIRPISLFGKHPMPSATPDYHIDPSGGTGSNGSPEVFPATERTVFNGEGWFKAMERVGITDPIEQRNLLDNNGLMEKLHHMGYAYKAQHLGGWGLYMPSNGVISNKAVRLIESARK
jgi:hypothetical protein